MSQQIDGNEANQDDLVIPIIIPMTHVLHKKLHNSQQCCTSGYKNQTIIDFKKY